ncbi:sigma-54 dependent transcriptional regulator [Rhodonellum sp.]|uniref:sigma-54-dependent transcriptional regulator n=1 Tax=Rhodonellum sp. TaxID=2231180 RepID=UPI0027178612|nr:sigma-54 dependent transcriptional regulator [Rhodonellum sp.]MDO9552776.1 sigma-54 dependent transcriptional regulator [Rhodonellum sp.]
MIKILLVEDDLTYSRIIKNFLEKNNFSVDALTKIEDAKVYLDTHQPSLIITDFRLPDGTGLEVLRYSKEVLEDIPVLLITNYSDIRVAVKAMKMGAFEYILKPINPDELLLTVNEALEGANESPKKKKKSAPKSDEDYIVGKSATSKHIEEHIQLVAPTDLTVIILGETGTGKEYIAKRIHQKSSRSHGQFVAIDCGALSKELAGSELFGHVKGSFTGALDNKIGHLEAAGGGTVFLDEVGNLSYDIQIKLLRALQERKIRKIGGNQEIPIDIRIIAATNEELLQQAKEGTFREDLYHRLNEFTITALPLRERKEDLMVFANQFLEQSNQKLGKNIKGFDAGAVHIFEKYTWPGNLRELKNIVRRAVLLSQSEYIGINSLPRELIDEPVTKAHEETSNVESADFKTSQMLQEKEMIIRVLQEVKYNKSKAAKTLGIDRKTLYNKMEKYGID